MDRSRMRTTRPLAALRAGRNDWYQIRAQAGGPTQVMVYDEIGYFGVTAGDFVHDLKDVSGPIDLHLNTPGGEVFDGIAIYEALKARGGVHVYVDSLAASIGSVIAMAGDTVTMAPNATMMIHDGWGMCVGNAADMQETAALLDKMSGNIASIYAERTGQPADGWRQAMRAETWYDAKEAVAAGLADTVGRKNAASADARLAAHFDLSVFQHPPRAAAGQPYRPQPYKREDWENVACPSCGKYNDDDAMYCGQCGTKLAGREDVTEDEPAPAAAQARLDAAPETELVFAAGVDHSAWDGAKAMANGAASDDPAAFYQGICAGRKAGDPAKQDSWALPYRYHPGDAPNADGVRNALSRLPQTDGLTNRAEAEALLNRLMKQINPDHDDSADRLDLPLWNTTEDQGDPFAEAMKGVLA